MYRERNDEGISCKMLFLFVHNKLLYLFNISIYIITITRFININYIGTIYIYNVVYFEYFYT